MKTSNKVNNTKRVSKVKAVVTPAPVAEVTPAPAPTKDELLAQLLASMGVTKDELLASLSPAPAPIAPAPISRAVRSAPAELGVPDLTSTRIDPTVSVSEWRLVSSQRKQFKGGYFVQGGVSRMDPSTGVDRFSVAVEIPFMDLYQAKLRLAQERNAMIAPAPAKVA